MILNNDIRLVISTGGSRKETSWKTERPMWSDFIQRLQVPAQSAETLEQYKAFPKAEQDNLKDVGGFVGGELTDGKRKACSVKGRSLVTLDLDNIPAGYTESIIKMVDDLGCAYAVYSTRKHEPVAPRLRVVLPSDRIMLPDEYEPAARKLAELIGLSLCDTTTFEASRMMYWPSISQGAPYIFNYADKPFLSVDGVLDMYQDWHNVKEWAKKPGEEKRVQTSLKRQQNPEEKDGIIGAFCRVYSVPDVIERFLPDTYQYYDTGRYTYSGGSTVAGAVVYDNDRFLYSNHATDPAGGRLCNSFDLVRIHKYGALDETAKPDTPTVKLPSYEAMRAFALQDEPARRNHMSATFGTAQTDESSTEWMNRLTLDGNGRIKATHENMRMILENDPQLKGKFQLDIFANRKRVLGSLPWDRSAGVRDFEDDDMKGLRGYLETIYAVYSPSKTEDAFATFLRENSINPIKDYLSSLQWDGIPRLDNAFIEYLGADDSYYVRMSARKMFCAAVARIFVPGIKFDYMPVIIGPQGIGKSTFLRIMGKDWYTDSLKISDMKDKKAAEKLLGNWIIEASEMDGMNRTDATTVKSFISAQEDIYRPAYGRETVRKQRQCIIVGTSNEKEFLKDDTGNRRFWPVDCGAVQPVKSVFRELEQEVPQMWAEAAARWSDGEELFPDDQMAEEAIALEEQHQAEDPRAGMVAEFMKKGIPADWYAMSIEDKRFFDAKIYKGQLFERRQICAAEIWCECFRQPLPAMTQKDSREINLMLKKTLKGWERDRLYYGAEYERQRGFENPNRLLQVSQSVPASVPPEIQ